ncbi:Hly-III related proteins [Bradyrhizobium sp. ORS 375]|uniref:PAQR family membrane homeostasis protein TrhA n=1 Tax=Bradyrhizobium sp. (strain ORS 375) TaxID=566679 RepID=UPI0002409086|nr:hemolysin III family protein [Bradyrhizobium sp. ORS 375]CCD91569.1 Hly-III related proteins [Bradyrhizobium sp. ORS 375]
MRILSNTLKAHDLQTERRRRAIVDLTAPIDWPYSPVEIRADLLIHVVGLCFAISAVLAMTAVLAPLSDVEMQVDVAIYLIGLLLTLSTSAAFNLWPISPAKWLLRRLDHSAIYVLIASTYMPFIARVQQPGVKLALLVSLWSTTAAGATVKLLMPGRYDRLALVAYLLMGWCGLTLCRAQADTLPPAVNWLMIGGGVSFSVGVVFHLWRRLRFQNAIWHCFVLMGIVLHYFAIFDIASNGHAPH